MAADEAREIMAAHRAELAAAAAAAAAEAEAQRQRRQAEQGPGGDASSTAASTRTATAPPWVLTDAAVAAAAASDARVSPAPFSLVRLAQTLAYNAWRLGAVWPEAGPFLSGLAQSRCPVARALGASISTDVALAALLGLSHPPPDAWRAEEGSAGLGVSALPPVDQEEAHWQPVPARPMRLHGLLLRRRFGGCSKIRAPACPCRPCSTRGPGSCLHWPYCPTQLRPATQQRGQRGRLPGRPCSGDEPLTVEQQQARLEAAAVRAAPA